MSSAATCLICGGSESRAIFDERGIEVRRCRDCGHVFSSHDAETDYRGYWGEAVEDPGASFWRDAHGAMYEDFFHLMIREAKGRLLDVGCGLGHFVKEMQTRFPAWETHGYEISPAAVRYASETVGAANVHLGRVEDAGFPPGSFDRITLWDVLEHLRQPDPLLAHLHGLLAPDGACLLHTPNVQIQVPKARLKRMLYGITDEHHYLDAADHLHLYSPRTARILLERNGFRVRFVHLRPIQEAVGLPGPAWRAAKNAWAGTVRVLDRLTAGAVNLDNLFIVARRADAAP